MVSRYVRKCAGEWRSFIKGLVNQSVSVSLDREALLQQIESSKVDRDALLDQIEVSKAERLMEVQAAKQQVQELQDNSAYQAEQLMELQNQVLPLSMTLNRPVNRFCFPELLD